MQFETKQEELEYMQWHLEQDVKQIIELKQQTENKHGTA